MRSYVNNNKNEKPKESLHMLMLILFLIPTNSAQALPRIIRFCNSMCTHESLMRIEYELNEFALTKTYS